VSAALGCKVVDEAVFALAEKKQQDLRSFFYSGAGSTEAHYERFTRVGMRGVGGGGRWEESQAEQHGTAAARRVFSATRGW